MKRVLVFVVVCLVGVGCSAAPEPSRSLSADDIRAIQTLDGQFRRLVQTSDWGGLSALFADQAVIMPPDAGVIAGPKAISEWFASASMVVQEFTGRSEAVGGSVDIALNRGMYNLVYTTGASPEPIREVGKYLWVLRRQPDNSWRITTQIWNVTQ